MNEKTGLVSLPIKPTEVEKFKKEWADPEKAEVKEKFLKVVKENDAEGLVIEALDWYSRNKEKLEKRVSKEFKEKPRIRVRKISEEYFPPCIKNILNGLVDGRKRSVFVLVTFLKNMGWSNEEIEKKIYEWNNRNKPPLRESFLRTQLRWHFRQERNLLPPNCENPTFYKDYGVCKPDETCLSGNPIKNPINYPFKLLFKKKKK